MVLAVVYLATLLGMVLGFTATPDHKMTGVVFSAALVSHFAAGIVLAIGAA